MDDLLYAISDDIGVSFGREIEGYEEGRAMVRQSPSRDLLWNRRQRQEIRNKRKEKEEADALRPALSPSELRRREEEARRAGRPRCPCAEHPIDCPCHVDIPCILTDEQKRADAMAAAAVPACPILPSIFGKKQDGEEFETDNGFGHADFWNSIHIIVLDIMKNG